MALYQMMTSCQYHQITDDATFIKGSLLDHVYVKSGSTSEAIPDLYVRPVYFSDHDAVCFSL